MEPFEIVMTILTLILIYATKKATIKAWVSRRDSGFFLAIHIIVTIFLTGRKNDIF